ncbi:hypothetical protein NA57DRAFT_58052 [Rhizodiscina lignyota]|uniref:Uncharacterized protein n=1 Tax=Rhizodiscina lignyota TaxID=1504668 RepID=A0A9P4M4Z6_9PEZI|nr:hypothetical protein NA57DRAFT_58052 [Rhizodiscina lignyota]
MASAPELASGVDAQQALFERLESYDWDNDAEFNQGLNAILASNPPPEQAAEIILRARCFYFARKINASIDFDAYKAWHATSQQSQRASTVTNGSSFATSAENPSEHGASSAPVQSVAQTPQGDAPYPTSFAQIVELITSGQPIPGIKDIPNTVLEGQQSESNKPKRRKPWEKDESAVLQETPLSTS